MTFEKTYNTISRVCNKFSENNINAYLVGGISAAIQTNTNLYRQNDDLDLMVDIKDLEKVISLLESEGYEVEDKRGIRTDNFVDKLGVFHPVDHELNADTKENLLGVGIFVYTRENGEVTLNSYSKNEKEGCVIGSRKVIPEELFDLMYSSEKVQYNGIELMSASKEYTYMLKSRGKREKDLQDASLLKKYIGEKELNNIKRIKQLELRIKQYFDKYDENGEVVSTKKVPELEETMKDFFEGYITANPKLGKNQIISAIMSEPKLAKILAEREDVMEILQNVKKIKVDSKEELVSKVLLVTHMYCYSDNFEEEFRKVVDVKERSFLEELQNQTFLPSENDLNTKLIGENKDRQEKIK